MQQKSMSCPRLLAGKIGQRRCLEGQAVSAGDHCELAARAEGCHHFRPVRCVNRCLCGDAVLDRQAGLLARLCENNDHVWCGVFVEADHERAVGRWPEDAIRIADKSQLTMLAGERVCRHAALDTEYGWPFQEVLAGTRFAGHPAPQVATVRVEDAGHPATAHLPGTWVRTDEWYDTQTNPRDHVHVLATVDEATYSGGSMGPDHPIAWCHDVGAGRSFVTAVGHLDESWSDPAVVDHVVGGIESVAAAVSENPCGT